MSNSSAFHASIFETTWLNTINMISPGKIDKIIGENTVAAVGLWIKNYAFAYIEGLSTRSYKLYC